MSEYQYYEFRAVDLPLTDGEIAELRALSTRASITATSFKNEYSYGNFRGDPMVLMQKYFDAFVYVANWGTRRFMLRLPATLLPPETANRYAIEPAVQVHISGDSVILEFALDEEEPEWVEGEGWLDSLLPLRDEIARGDLRALYIGWLSAHWMGDIECFEEEEDEEREPPVPPRLKKLSVPLRKLVDFLQVDPDLLAVAALGSESEEEKPESIHEREVWLQRLPDAYKNTLLLQVMQGEEMAVRAKLLQRFRQDTAPPQALAEEGGRTMGELLAAAEEYREKRERREKEQAARERERRTREEAAAREKYLDDLAGREEATWKRIESLLEVRRGPEYEQAARLVVDLRDVAQRQGTMPDFVARLSELRTRHASKPAFMRRLDAAKLR
jgi:hypothetical protein